MPLHTQETLLCLDLCTATAYRLPPTPDRKPLSALHQLSETFTQPGAIVLDPFAGSGSTCVAAEECGRRWIGIELLKQYHAAGLRRLYARRSARAA